VLNTLKHKVKEAIYKIIPPPHANESFSQAGEDCVIDFLLQELNIQTPSYLELGVCNPIIGSNTYRFYKRGANGILVEADSTQIEFIKKARPNDKVINLGISASNQTEAEFYVFDIQGYNTFIKEEALHREKNSPYKIIRIDNVKLESINNIISQNFSTYPTLLSIDIEGLDFEVLKSLDTEQFPIPIICAETCTYSETHIKPKDLSIDELMKSKGYVVYADTYINTIFVHENWFNTIKPKK
jgi:FkbM family methyltransferase